MNRDQRDWVHQVYDQHAPDLYRLARHRLGDPDLAYDMVQEVFLVLVDRAPQVREHPNLMAWLITTLNHKLLHEFDRQEAKGRRESPDTELSWLPDSRDPKAHSLEEILPRELTQQDRTILKLVYEEGLTYREAAGRLNIPPATCGTWLHRARQKCRKYLTKEV